MTTRTGTFDLAGVIDALAEVEAGAESGAQQIATIAALEKIKGAAAAAQARVTARMIDRREAAGEDTRSIRAEIALARRCSPTWADRHVGIAKVLTSEMPQTMAALTRGELTERRAGILVTETACLSREHRAQIDSELATVMTTLGDKALAGAARRAAAALDPAALTARTSRAVASRRVSVRAAADGMAWLSILGPMTDIIGAHTALTRWEKQRHHISPDLPSHFWEAAAAHARSDTRSPSAWITDHALQLLSGRATDQPQPIAINLVMTDTALFPGCHGQTGGAPRYDDTAYLPGWGPLPGAHTRAHLHALLTYSDNHPDNPHATTWLRRLFTDPTGHDLTHLDSTRRRFHGALRTFLQLRDPTCRIPYCDAPTRDLDHTTSVHQGGATRATNGTGLCQRHNLTKEHPGWRTTTTSTGLDNIGPHSLTITTPTGHTHTSTASPIHGHGWRPPPPPDADPTYQPTPPDLWDEWPYPDGDNWAA